jgi:catechol 2,3-dioxygenase-like lactoylglutathione lyase family enzyme
MRRFHIAVGVRNIDASIADYASRLGAAPVLIVPGEYALWRTDALNFSIRQSDTDAGRVRHLGWEDDAATEFVGETDVNGVLWERFNREAQLKEIRGLWPSATDQ